MSLIISPRKALNKAYLKSKPLRSNIESFKENLIKLLEQINHAESEEFNKNVLSDFLKNTYYKDNYSINTKGRNDLVIHNGKTAQETVGVIIEAKRASNAEMLKQGNINTKAMQELVLYYLRERITNKNLEVKHLIATSVNEWFIFDANVFEKHFAQNKKLIKQFEDFETKVLSITSTDDFYKEIARNAIDEVKGSIEFTYINISDFEVALKNSDKGDDAKLIPLYKILSPQHLLKATFANDSNSLNKSFYTELLHIIGLEETKDGGKKLIARKKEGERYSGTLIESAIIQLDSENLLSELPNRKQYGETKEEQLFNVAIELAITWINRILFLKLLEAQLITYHKNDKSYAFLNIECIKDFDELNTLFFQVLAIKVNDRNGDVKTKFAKVPYLNSSLFERSEIEGYTLRISNLSDSKKIPILSSTVLKSKQGKKIAGELNAVEYIFAFLEAYDFASDGSEDIQEDNKTLINASVLGLIFEKINGYKDGSFFTPGFVTMYMSREVIRKSVIQKFNDFKGWNCTDLIDLVNHLGTTKQERDEANAIINSIKICDPAVGSGHFLVSALNELIAIKAELELLQDKEGKLLKKYSVEVVNDELIVSDEDGELLDYNPKNIESQRVQETLFNEKQTIIENCLFGVDINPNSVKICRLRLWIELLKNAYYKEDGELETLPNIDINIKCGNSLVGRFDLGIDLKDALKKSKLTIAQYKSAVQSYRAAKSKDEKWEMERLINEVKTGFRTEIFYHDPKARNLENLRVQLKMLELPQTLLEESASEKKERNKKRLKLKIKFDKLGAEIEEIKSNKIYENAFEWRFEFPEVLNDEGEFVGFDLIIGNPPYIALEEFSDSYRNYFRSKFTQFERKFETSVLFIVQAERLIKPNYYVSYIAPQTWQTGENFNKFRAYLISQLAFKKIINLPFNVFEDAYVDTSIYVFRKSIQSQYELYNYNKKDKITTLDDIEYESFDANVITQPDFKVVLDKSVSNLLIKFNNSGYIKLGEITKSTQGLSGSNFTEVEYLESDFIFPFLSVGNVYNFKLTKSNTYYTSLKDKPSLMQFYIEEPKILIRRIINRQDRLTVGYCNERLVFKKDINPFICTDNRFNTYYLLGLLASKFMSHLYLKISSIANKDDFRQTTLSELRKLPIPLASSNKQLEIASLVQQIIKCKESELDATLLEEQVEKLVYEVYGLSEDIALAEKQLDHLDS